MTKKPKSSLEEVTTSLEDLASIEVDLEAPADTPRGLSSLEKVRLMGDLASALENKEVLEALRKLSSSEKIIQIFTAAMEREVEAIMGGGSTLDTLTVNNTVLSLREAEDKAIQLARFLSSVSGSPIIKALNIMYASLTGEKPQMQQQRQQQPQQQQQIQPSGQMPPTPPYLGGY